MLIVITYACQDNMEIDLLFLIIPKGFVGQRYCPILILYDCTFGCNGYCWKVGKEKRDILTIHKHIVCIDRMDNTHKIANYSHALGNHYFLYCWLAGVY